jgi:hypothetical protein
VRYGAPNVEWARLDSNECHIPEAFVIVGFRASLSAAVCERLWRTFALATLTAIAMLAASRADSPSPPETRIVFKRGAPLNSTLAFDLLGRLVS